MGKSASRHFYLIGRYIFCLNVKVQTFYLKKQFKKLHT